MYVLLLPWKTFTSTMARRSTWNSEGRIWADPGLGWGTRGLNGRKGVPLLGRGLGEGKEDPLRRKKWFFLLEMAFFVNSEWYFCPALAKNVELSLNWWFAGLWRCMIVYGTVQFRSRFDLGPVAPSSDNCTVSWLTHFTLLLLADVARDLNSWGSTFNCIVMQAAWCLTETWQNLGNNLHWR